MQRVVSSFVLLTLICVVAAQPPAPPAAPIPPAPGVIPAVGASPAPAAPAAGDGTLAQFEPLNAFPQSTQAAVRSIVHGSNWLTRMNQPQGRFQVGYRPALRQPMEGDDDLKQARATLALARCARFTGSERQAAVAGQAILTLLAVTKLDPADPNCRVPVVSAPCNREGFAANLALSVYELPGADEKLLAEAERLCQFLRTQLRTDGSIQCSEAADESAVNEHAGTALSAIIAGNRVKPAAWKTDAMKRAIEHYRAHFKAHPHPMLAATLAPAFTECFLQTKWADAAAATLEMNDWLLALQYPGGDPRYPLRSGGFKSFVKGQPVESEPGFECGQYLFSLACGYHVLRFQPDLDRAAKYKQALADAVAFTASLQYTEENTRHFENGFRAGTLIGGFYLSPTDGNLRIDASAACLSGLIRYLNCGVEKN